MATLLYRKMSLTQDKIIRLRKLTALSGNKEISIDSVLDSFDSLKDIEIRADIRTTRSGKGILHPRPDIVAMSATPSDEFLACTKQRVIGHQIALGSIMHGE